MHRFGWGVKIFALVVAAVAAFGFAVMLLWKWHPIDFLQAVGLLILCRLLIGGFRGRGGAHLHWRARLAERLENMTPEEREKFRAGLRAGCGWHHSVTEKEPEGHGPAT